MICDVFTPNGDPFPGDPRWVLRRQLERLKKLGYVLNMGPELEFFLLRRSAEGVETLPHDGAGYFDLSEDLGTEVRKEMMNGLEDLGIKVETAHHEVATGQHEIDFEYADALRTADNAVTFKTTLKAVAASRGLYATFMPKPFFGINGSGMHVHQSLWDTKKGSNAFRDPKDPYGLSETARQYIAGTLSHARGMIAILAPLVNTTSGWSPATRHRSTSAGRASTALRSSASRRSARAAPTAPASSCAARIHRRTRTSPSR